MKYIDIVRGHYDVAKEHCKNLELNHTPTIWQAIYTTILDILYRKTIFDKETKSYLIYSVVNKPTMGIRAGYVYSMYTPPEHRGKGVMSKMLDSIPEKFTMALEEDNDKEIEKYVRLYVIRTNI